MPFKHGRLAEILHGTTSTAIDLSPYLFSANMSTYVNTAEVSTFKNTYRAYISGEAFSQFFSYGYYDPTLTAVRLSLQAAVGVVNYAPAGATAIGDQSRLLSFNTVDYKESPSTNKAVGFSWSIDSTSPVGFGVSLHPLASENVGTITGTGDGVMTSLAGTGLIAHLHVTAYTAGTHQFKLQDATTQGGAYTDITGGAFTNMTSAGAQRLIVTGTVRQFVRVVATIGTAAATYSIAVARYPT
jgi:hypothetical protein